MSRKSKKKSFSKSYEPKNKKFFIKKNMSRKKIKKLKIKNDYLKQKKYINKRPCHHSSILLEIEYQASLPQYPIT